jgi:hypothetical protein
VIDRRGMYVYIYENGKKMCNLRKRSRGNGCYEYKLYGVYGFGYKTPSNEERYVAV